MSEGKANTVRKVIPDTINAIQRIGGSLDNIDHEISRIHNLNQRLETSLGMPHPGKDSQHQLVDGENLESDPGILEELELIVRDKREHAEASHKDLEQEISNLAGLIDIILGSNPQD